MRFFAVFFKTILMLVALSACAPVMDATSDGPIRQNPGTRTLGTVLDDDHIEDVTLVNIKKVGPEMRKGHFDVVSFNGVVLLVGQVATDELRSKAAAAASKVQKVRQVQNALTVGPNISFGARSYDSWLTTKIKTKYAFNNDVNGQRIKVITENGVIYLMGLVTQQEADRAAAVAQRTDGAQRVVKAFEYID
ncbi:MAG TPA: BON domain-containing protein [Pseudomonadales bacterium]|nr:BON domain-containing protein [Pseudomonadales bacterium]